MPGPVVSIFQDFYISYDPNQRIGGSLWAICVCEAVACPSSLCPFSFVERINSSENQIVPFALKIFEGRSLVWSYIRGGPLEVANSLI